MNFQQAYEKELARGLHVIYAAAEATCEICGKQDELRIGACFDCKSFIETDMIEAWDRRHPEKRWPYAWVAQPPVEATEEEIQLAQRIAEYLHDLPPGNHFIRLPTSLIDSMVPFDPNEERDK